MTEENYERLLDKIKARLRAGGMAYVGINTGTDNLGTSHTLHLEVKGSHEGQVIVQRCKDDTEEGLLDGLQELYWSVVENCLLFETGKVPVHEIFEGY